MFIVKAVHGENTPESPYSMYTCDYYRVSNIGGMSNDKDRVFAQKHVDLFEAHPTDHTCHGEYVANLQVGPHEDHFSCVYIMNEKGKTVDTIYTLYPVTAPTPAWIRDAAR